MTTKISQKITPFLWFDDKAEEAAKFYTSIFKNSKVGKMTKYDEEAAKTTGRPAGSVMTVEFELEGQQFVALNGGPMFKLTEAISFVVNCETQEEVDYYWSKLSAGGEESRCGWLTDKFGLSWQVVPVVLIEMLADEEIGVHVADVLVQRGRLLQVGKQIGQVSDVEGLTLVDQLCLEEFAKLGLSSSRLPERNGSYSTGCGSNPGGY